MHNNILQTTNKSSKDKYWTFIYYNRIQFKTVFNLIYFLVVIYNINYLKEQVTFDMGDPKPI